MRATPDFNKARQYCINRLRHDLSTLLTYHSAFHTINEVVPAADRLAAMEYVEGSQHLLLLTAAYFHDLGFTQQRQGHEAASIQIAMEVLPSCQYSPDQIEVIRGIIQATCIPQSPTNVLEQIMADADLDYLGSENFWERSCDLRQEHLNYGTEFTVDGWYRYQLKFIQAHRYFTTSQRLFRQDGIQRHVSEIQKQLDQYLQHTPGNN